MVLSHGRALYCGPGGLAPAEYFTSRGQASPPEGYNIAEHLLDIASEAQVGLFSESGSLTEKDANGLEKVGGGSGTPIPEMTYSENAAQPKSKYATTFLTQFEVLAGREWKILRRLVSAYSS